MSLLNKALRKKDIERTRSGESSFLYKPSTASKKGKTKTYVIALVVVFIIIIGALGVLKFYYLPGSASIEPRLIAQRSDAKSVEPADENQSNSTVTGNKQEEKNTMQVAVTSEQQKPHETPKNRPVTEPKKDLTPRLKTEAAVVQKKKDKIFVKETIQPSIDHETLDPFFQKALTYHRQNRLDEAIQMYREVLLKNPKHAEALFNLAAAYVKMGNFSNAYPMIEKLNHMDPENPQILLNLAIVEIGLGKPQSALNHLDTAEKQHNAPQFEINFHRSVALSKLGKLDEAMAWYQKAEKLRSQHPRLLFNMALLYDKMQNYPKAIRYYSSYLQQNVASLNEKKDIEARILTLNANRANQSKRGIEPKP